MIRTLIVDDVELAREAIRIRLHENKDFDVVGEAATGTEAVKLIRKLVPDLVFLDVQLPGLDAFQLLNGLGPAHSPAVIFVTAHDRYAVPAFNWDALHFLLKPIDDDRFDEALRRARNEIGHEEQDDPSDSTHKEISLSGTAPDGKSRYWSRLVIRDHDRFVLLKTGEVTWVASAANYVEVHAGAQSFIVRIPIGDLESKLDPARFARISRSTIVNIERIREIRILWHGDFEVVLKDGTPLRMSRRYRDRLLTQT